MTTHNSRAVRSAAVALALAGLVAQADAQNGYSFLKADESGVDYGRPRTRAVMSCKAFMARTTHDYTVLSAERIDALGAVPAHCRIDGVIPPEIDFQVNLPLDWNGRLYMHGNGGYAGTPADDPGKAADRDKALTHRFATAYTNTGHDADREPLASFALNNRQKEIDYAFRAVHLTVETTKVLIGDFYGRGPAFSYWDGCSTGGRQGLMSAQRFPADFDGIVVGAPVLNFSGTQIWGVWNGRALAEADFPAAKLDLVADAVYAQCDAVDGVEDGLIRDPRACDFDPARDVAQCGADGAGNTCLTEVETNALKKIYAGVQSRGETWFPGLPVGAERGGWDQWIVNDNGPSRQYAYGETFLKYLAFNVDDPDYKGTDFDFDADVERIAAAARLLNADDPDLRAFAPRGGKILSYFGWADQALNPQMGVDYYESVLAEMGDSATREFYRMYMVPGMYHCRGGLGVDRIDALTPLIDWVERGIVPERIVADRVEDGRSVRSRPVCPYPEVAVYDGRGSIDAADNFRCELP